MRIFIIQVHNPVIHHHRGVLGPSERVELIVVSLAKASERLSVENLAMFHFAWPRVSSGSDGLYLSPLSHMSPATSDCLEPYFSGGFYFIFQLSRVC